MASDDEVVEEYLTAGEVAALFRVDPFTVSKWAKQGRIPSIRTPGGHRRYPKEPLMKYLRDQS